MGKVVKHSHEKNLFERLSTYRRKETIKLLLFSLFLCLSRRFSQPLDTGRKTLFVNAIQAPFFIPAHCFCEGFLSAYAFDMKHQK